MDDRERDQLLIRLDERTERLTRDTGQALLGIKAMGEVHAREQTELRTDLNSGLSSVRADLQDVRQVAFSAEQTADRVESWLVWTLRIVVAAVLAAGLGLVLI